MAQQQQYKTYEDLFDDDRGGCSTKIDKRHGQMFNLPDDMKWMVTKDFFGTPRKKGDAQSRFLDLRVCGYLLGDAKYAIPRLRGRVGGLLYEFPFWHHRDENGTRHLCTDFWGSGSCPRCEKYRMRRETLDDSKETWKKMIAPLSPKASSVVCGFVNGDSQLCAFEFSDTAPFKNAQATDTFFYKLSLLTTQKNPTKPLSQRVSPTFFGYGKDATILRLNYAWEEKHVDGKDMSYWRLDDVFKVTEEDGAPSADADPQLAYKIKPWEWLDVEGERKRMLENDGTVAKRDTAPDFDKMDYAGLMAFAMENSLSSVLEDGYTEQETDTLRAAVKMEVKK